MSHSVPLRLSLVVAGCAVAGLLAPAGASAGGAVVCQARPTGQLPRPKWHGDPPMARQPRTDRHAAYDAGLVLAAKAGPRLLAGTVSQALWEHYLGASGNTYTVPMNSLLRAQPRLLADLDGALRGSAGAAVALLGQTPPAGWRALVDIRALRVVAGQHPLELII